jgi:outer membrane protein insertion porin family
MRRHTRVLALTLAILLAGVAAPLRAQQLVPVDAPGEAAPPAPPPTDPAEPAPGFTGSLRYLVRAIEVRGNRKTDPALIVREVGIKPGDVITPDDARVLTAELRLYSLGFFQRVGLRLRKAEGAPAADRSAGSPVVLVVEVEERGTVLLNALYLGTSESTLLWGGLDVSETNFLGRGITIGGGFVQSTRPTVPEAEAGRAVTFRVSGPPRRDGLLLGGSFLFLRGSEFFQTFGSEDEVDPKKWRALGIRRLGGTLSVGGELTRSVRFTTEGRFEAVRADLPAIRTRDLGGVAARPIDFMIHEGSSRLASLTAVLDFDTRSDPVLPARGRRIAVSVEAAAPVLGSNYSYAKGIAQASFYFPAVRGHVVALHGFTGGIFGEAPYFNRFFVGDLNALLPPRALGLNFATLPSRNFLDNAISGKRYESFAARALVEYAVPLWRGRRFFYRGDAFAAFGAFGLASLDDLRFRDNAMDSAVPIDLTADLGLRMDTYIGIFILSVANALGRVPF